MLCPLFLGCLKFLFFKLLLLSISCKHESYGSMMYIRQMQIFVQARICAWLIVCTKKSFCTCSLQLQKDEYVSWYHLFFPPVHTFGLIKIQKQSNALISLCDNGHNPVQAYCYFQPDAPRCIHDKNSSAPLTNRPLSVISFLSLLFLFSAFMVLWYQR